MEAIARQLDIIIAGKKVKLNYHIQGSGPKSMITFHGFGQTGMDMNAVAKAFKNTHTTYHFDLFFHGKSHWHTELEVMEKSIWLEVMKNFLIEEGIDRFSLAAFSMGGKFALATIELFSERIDEVYFIAPDGIRTSPWYSLATYPGVLRNYFRSTIVRPGRFFRVVKGARRLRVVDKGIEKFVTREMDSKKKRRRVYYSWIVFSELQFNLEEIAGLIRKNQIKLTMITGKYDRIIQTAHMHRLTRYLPESISIEVESGHNQVVNKGMELIAQKKM